MLGRDDWLSRLNPLPFVTLLRAPASTGKRTVALYSVRQAGVSAADFRVFPELEYRDEYGRPVERSSEGAIPFEPELTIDCVREMRRWTQTVPQASPFKVAVIRLDHVRPDGTAWRASQRSLATMLKLLEEPPPTIRFILLASRPTSPTIRSRSVELTAGLLPIDVIASILYRVSDLSEKESEQAARSGGGRVGPSLLAWRETEASRQAVVGALTALRAGDTVALTEKARLWTDSDTELLARWAHERVTGRWSVFVGDEVPPMSSLVAERVLRLLSGVRGARPRVILGALVALARS